MKQLVRETQKWHLNLIGSWVVDENNIAYLILHKHMVWCILVLLSCTRLMLGIKILWKMIEAGLRVAHVSKRHQMIELDWKLIHFRESHWVGSSYYRPDMITALHIVVWFERDLDTFSTRIVFQLYNRSKCCQNNLMCLWL